MSLEAQSNEGEIGRLEALGTARPDSPGIAALAEARRRSGDAAGALRLAEEGLADQPELAAARIARALALLDLDRAGEARLELERVLEAVPDHPIAESLSESMGAEPEVDGLLDPVLEHGEADAQIDPVFEHAPADGLSDPLPELAEAELDAALEFAHPETGEMHSTDSFAAAAIQAAEREDLRVEPGLVPLDADGDSPFATATVAGLLEDQGHDDEAESIRRGLEPAAAAPAKEEGSSVLPTLERWLDTLRRRTG